MQAFLNNLYKTNQYNTGIMHQKTIQQALQKNTYKVVKNNTGAIQYSYQTVEDNADQSVQMLQQLSIGQ